MLKHCYTLRDIRHALQAMGLCADIGTASSVLIGTDEFIIAAALARSTVGA